ncbi:MAG: polyphosphate polymerase domain-containing protein [Bacteroidetes bacterium]|nr:polyphosphate polymerase domain-containing protein [Bacteroidota bacterium]MBU1679531.1 polyphosphate polymerase domain-containing protein [Bacteroidota bacterium]MBU2506440.1 polyphosphate polymerase domain-containing protein [Bacteroidota bacterium]
MRLEYKYLVPLSSVNHIRKRLFPYVDIDEFASECLDNTYTVRSIYFDTSQLSFYHEKIDGLQIRKKIRIRGYNDYRENNIVFLEIKRKNDNYINKNRSPIMFHNVSEFLNTKDFDSFILTNYGTTASYSDAEMFIHNIHSSQLKPIILVVYEREAYTFKFDDRLRITFDKNLRYVLLPSIAKLYSDEEMYYPLQKYFILEIKFSNGFPSWLQRILMDFNLGRMALSKYTICLDDASSLKSLNNMESYLFTRAVDYLV